MVEKELVLGFRGVGGELIHTNIERRSTQDWGSSGSHIAASVYRETFLRLPSRPTEGRSRRK